MTANAPIDFDQLISMIALEAGFMISTSYGQATNKHIPVSDKATLVKFGRMLAGKIEAQTIERCFSQVYERELRLIDIPKLYGPKSDKEEGKS